MAHLLLGDLAVAYAMDKITFSYSQLANY